MSAVLKYATVGILVLLPVALLHAQGKEPVIGGYETSGSVTAGYRFTDVSGSENKYLELFDLKPGFRLMEADLFGRATEKENSFADWYSVNMSGLGGDPYPGGQVAMTKVGLYDVRLNYRQHYYYWNRNDDQPNPGGLPGLSINHDWATVRRFGSAFFTLNATQNLRFTFDYNRDSRDGTTFVTRALDYFGSPDSWGSFTRANPYYLQAPVNEVANRFAGGVAYSWHRWNFFYRLGYQTFEQNLLLDNVLSPQRSINLGDPVTAGELLQRASFNQFRRLKTPISEFSYVGQASKSVDLRGDYIYYRYRGPVSQNLDFNGTARITGTTLGNYTVVENDRANVSETNNIVDQGITFKLSNQWNLLADYRFAGFTEDGVLNADSLRDGVTAIAGTAGSTWEYNFNRLDIQLEYAPGRKLLVRPGVRLIKRDVDVTEDGILDPVRSKTSKFVAPILSAFYAPTDRLTIRGNVQSITNDTPYTRISARTDIAERWIVRYRLRERATIENSALFRTAKYNATNFRNSIRSNATVLTYAFNNRVAAFGGFAYDSFFATTSVTFIRGTPPLDATWRDQTINRIWQLGIDARVLKRLTLKFAGNYVRTTGVGEISGEPPTQGPIRFPMGIGTITYDFGKPGRLSLDLQRTEYIEQILPGDNFNANVLVIRWTKDF